jgi:hypothetical protein
MFKISIPKPCFKGWENMTPNEQGRFCDTCAKTVVDFSVMSDEAIQNYIAANYGEKMCGRFRTSQIQRIVIDLPQNIFHIQVPYWKKFLVVFLICFGGSFFSIDTTIAGVSSREKPYDFFYKKTYCIKTDKNKRGHNKRKKYKRKKSQNIFVWDGTTIIMGNMWGPTSDRDINPFELPKIRDIESAGTGSSIKKNNDSNNPQRKPQPEIPLSTTVFVLPATLAYRNPFSKKKKA